MEKLNEYLQQLLSSCAEELRLEPDKNPYLVSENRTTDVASVPLMGTQISTMVFPLIPAAAKSTLPSQNEVEFVHPHNLGNFNFTVQKSPAGFVVTIRPLIAEPGSSPAADPLRQVSPVYVPDSAPTLSPPVSAQVSPPVNEEPAIPQTYELESSASLYKSGSGQTVNTGNVSGLVIEERENAAPEFVADAGDPEIEVVSVNDPEYQTVFSDTAPDPPRRRRSDLLEMEYSAVTVEEPSTPQVVRPIEPQPTVPPPAPEPVFAPEPQFPSQHEFVPPASQVSEQPVFVPASANSVMAARMDALFNAMAEMGASDLHLSVSMPPMVRKDGKMRVLQQGDAALTAEVMRDMLTSIMPAKNQEEFARRHDTDFAYEIPGLARFRCNIFMDRKGMGAVFRIIPSKILTAEQLGLSKAIMDLCALSKGLVVVTGPTGSGKSTTLCAMVDSINKTREDHIITIEDPIEFVHDNQKCLVNQREVHNHTDSFKDALRAALREDPDILLVGEMRDLETISIAIETAETGHLVFGTLHTTTAASTVDRIIDQFPADRQQQIRVMLSESLKGVIAQTLLPKKGGGRVAALEVLIVTPAISNLIREGKTFQIPSAMQTGKNHGMVMLNDALFEHVKNGLVEPLDAYMKAVDKTGFETILQRGGFSI
jgi:twitching motility protein PilT